MTHELVLSGVNIHRQAERLLSIDAHIGPGEVLTVMGPSGSGKSTLLSYVAGLLDPAFTAAGRVLLDGRDISGLPPEERRIGLMFQDPLLFPHLSVGSNLLFGVGRRVPERRARVRAALAAADLVGFEDRDPATLSGGQKARVALMRVLLSEPHALLLDEPFSKLDTALRSEIRSFVFARARAEGLPSLLVTHDPADAEAAGGPVIQLGD
ncbi:MAG: ATP-binding cassette domain-containing protein [Hyphomicrobiaceae bacterium]